MLCNLNTTSMNEYCKCKLETKDYCKMKEVPINSFFLRKLLLFIVKRIYNLLYNKLLRKYKKPFIKVN